MLAGVIFLQQLVAVTIESLGGTYWFNNDYFGQQIYYEFTPPAFAVFLMKVDPILVSLILFSWMQTARIVNTLVINLKYTDFIQAARALGGNSAWIILRHLIPNSIGPAMVLAARDVGSSVILQATIIFIGMGGVSPWGILLSQSRNWVIGSKNLLIAWWVYLPVILTVVLFGVGWNLFGEGLNEAFDPSFSVPRSKPSRWIRQGKTHIASPENLIESAGHRPGKSQTISQSLPMFRVSGPPELDPVLYTARKAMASENLDLAMHAYSHLVEHNRQVDVIILDLAQVAVRFPHIPIVWKMLGDALARSGNHEYAKKSYEQYRRLTQ
jgi:hypothetical protein